MDETGHPRPAAALLRRLSMRSLPVALIALLLASTAAAEDEIFEKDAKLKKESGEGTGGEGPAWHPKLGVLTSGNNHVCRLDRDGKSSIYRKNAGTNGLLFDQKGRLVACEAESRRITRLELDGKLT